MTLQTKLRFHAGFKSALLAYLRPVADTGCFVDIGANCGQTMYEAYRFNSAVRDFGFEPNPQAFALLQNVAKEMGVDPTLFPWACGTERRPVKLFASSALDTSATTVPVIRPDTYEGVNGSWIASYPLDMIGPELGLAPGFVLKIDVEGAENEVLGGAVETISKYRPFIICEVLHAHRTSEIELNNLRKAEIERLLAEHGYTIYLCDIDPRTGVLSALRKIRNLPRNAIWRDSPHTCDFLFAPRELHGG